MPDPPDRPSTEITRVLAAEGVSVFGSMLSRLAIPWFAALVLAATPLQMGWLQVADIAAGALGALLLGSLVDRWRQRAVMLVADLLRAALLALLAGLAALGLLSFGLLLAASAAAGLLTLAFELARSAWMAQRITAEHLPRRNAQLSMVGSLSETAAFALGGWLFQGLGASVALFVDALSYVVSAGCLHGVADAPPAPVADAAGSGLRRLFDDAADGVHAIVARAALRALAATEVLVALSASLSATSYMIFVSRDIGFPTGPLGLIFATGGLGAVVGAAWAPRLGRRLGLGAAMAFGLAAFALGASCIPLVVAPGWLGAALLVAHQVVGDAGQTVYSVHERSLRQTAVPAALLARVDAGIRSVAQLATLAGALCGGWFATALGTGRALVLAAALAAAAAVVAAFTLARRPAA